jgi:hypothetical protein
MMLPTRKEQRKEASQQRGEERFMESMIGKTISLDKGSRELPAFSPQFRA